MKNYNKKSAFTLAEVLITLGIIGVVAAITIPELIQSNKAARLHAAFKESYSIVQQAFKLMEADDVSTDPDDYPTGTFYKTFMNYLKGTIDCGASSSSGVKKTAPCYYASSSNSTDAYTSLDGNKTVAYNWFDDGQIALNNGMLILFENYTTVDQLWVHVDLNGYNNPPNRWGYDLFTFEFLDGELRTMGDTETTYNDLDKYCNLDVSNKYNGIACAHYAKVNSDYFKNIVKKVK